eukprot:m.101085 g.101085  ORF g.101085 m.101085 type:complete len:609 (-) comp10374_c0_seq2:47-1873(-)
MSRKSALKELPRSPWFNLVNCSTGGFLTDPIACDPFSDDEASDADTDEAPVKIQGSGAGPAVGTATSASVGTPATATPPTTPTVGSSLSAESPSEAQEGRHEVIAMQRPPSDNLTSQLWCWVGDGQLCSASGNILVTSAHGRAGTTVRVQSGTKDAKGLQLRWRIDVVGALVCGGSTSATRSVVDAKNLTGASAGRGGLTLQPRRSFAASSQRWIAVPRPSPGPGITPLKNAWTTFMLASTSGKVLDACSDGRITTFEPHPGAESQRWRFLCGPHGLYLQSALTREVATLHWVEASDGDGQLSHVRLSPRTSALHDRQLWSFDAKGFLVSRHSGWVLDSMSAQDGGAVAATERRTSIAGLGLFFKNFSNDSQIWHIVLAESRQSDSDEEGSSSDEDDGASASSSPDADTVPGRRSVYSNEALDAALAELDEFGDELRASARTPDGCDQALEALDLISAQLCSPDRTGTPTDFAAISAPRALPPARRTDSVDVLWQKLASPAEQNTALKQITEHVWTSVDGHEAGRLYGDSLKPMLELSGLPNTQLLEIWGLVDTGNIGSVTFSQLLVLMALLAQAQRGEVPNYSKLDLACAAPPHLEGIDIKFSEVWM